ncbi:MAG TPA: 3-isopropylmalate dehydratase large subunit [Clostridiales bacterium]|jgi:3-isopropylmalate/(R)-2-methylmalate dehydratase large subunit|nr:3-isopropylmalate dehydratase large subunit [Clostridiales bacterium]HCG35745.1 3-isopropylmalate dehydratase large subunit [Clostridiales bacterium]
MGMTLTQKIIAAHCGRKRIKAGEIVMANVDMVMGNDITSPIAIREFEKNGFIDVFNRNKVSLVMDHFTPNKDIKAAEQCKTVRCFARDYRILHFYDVGKVGIEHALLPEKGLVGSGDLVIGADSHTCTYGAMGAFSTGAGSTDMAYAMATGQVWLKVPVAIRFLLKNKPSKWVSGKDVILHIIGMIGVSGARYRSMEFCGNGVSSLSMDDRFCIANMAIEAGAKNGIFEADEKTEEYEQAKRKRTMRYTADEDAEYEKTYEIDLSKIRPTVACPHSPDNTRAVEEAGDIPIDQVVIGSCTNGRLEDLANAAMVMNGRKVSKYCRTIIIPATQKIYLEALEMGFITTFIEAGCAVSTPTCGPCLGGHMGILAKGERAASTTNRNFVGRMGHPESEVYLVSPAVAAATAIAGKLVSPEQLGGF